MRLVTNPEKMVLRETQRAFVYFTLHGLTVDRIIVNRVIPATVRDEFFASWRISQSKTLDEIEAYFAPVPIQRVPMFAAGNLGLRAITGVGQEPVSWRRRRGSGDTLWHAIFFPREADRYEVTVDLPFAEKAEVGLFKKDDELIIRSVPCAGMLDCRPRWLLCSLAKRGWKGVS